MSGHAPTSSESTLKYGSSAAPARPANITKLASNRIPESCANVVKGGAARRVVDQIRTTQQVERQVHGLREGNPQSGTGLHEIRPILALGVDGDVAVPMKLHRAEIVPGAGFRVGQTISVETAHAKRIHRSLRQPHVSIALPTGLHPA